MKRYRVKIILEAHRDLVVSAESGEAAERWAEDNLLKALGGEDELAPIIWNEGEVDE